MKSLTLASFILPGLAMAFPQMASKRYSNATVPYSNTTSPTPPSPAPSGHPTPDIDTYPNPVCTPGKYQCHYDTYTGWGWSVCNTSAKWEYAGSCAAAETCVFNTLNGSPYCLPSAPVTPTEPDAECYPDTYQCAYTDAKGWYINACEDGYWTEAVDCAAGETCTYSPVKGYPYCKPKEDAKVCAPGTYQCSYDSAKGLWGWDVCTVEGQWVSGGYCKSSETCSFNALNGSPYCL
jgi:hypothetical protein